MGYYENNDDNEEDLPEAEVMTSPTATGKGIPMPDFSTTPTFTACLFPSGSPILQRTPDPLHYPKVASHFL